MIIWYRNSFLASLVSIAGCIAAMVAILLFTSGEIMGGILVAAIAAGLLYGAKLISEKRSFDKWWKQVERANLEPEIRRSRETAVEIYKKNPEQRTLEKIRALNPGAAKYIENGFKEPAAPSRPAPAAQAAPSRPTPAAAPAPKQQVSQPVAMRQQTPISVPKSVPAQGGDLSAQMDQIMAEVTENARGAGDPDAYWDCAQRLEALLSANPENTVLRGHLSALYFLYAANAFSVADESFEKRTQVFTTILRSMYLSDRIKPDDMDYYSYLLLRHAVETVLEATHHKNRNKMQTAYHRLDLVVNYRIVGVDEPMRRMMVYNDAVNNARAWLCFWMAHSYAKEDPKNLNLAKMYIDESVRYCPMTPVRNCDLNPQNNDQSIVMDRADILRMRDLIYM